MLFNNGKDMTFFFFKVCLVYFWIEKKNSFCLVKGYSYGEVFV